MSGWVKTTTLFRLRVFVSVCLMKLAGNAIFVAARLWPESIGRQITLSPSVTVELTGKAILPQRVETVATGKPH